MTDDHHMQLAMLVREILRSRYQGLEGDKELVAVIERDVLNRNPGVRFDDIAGQEEAKKVTCPPH